MGGATGTRLLAEKVFKMFLQSEKEDSEPDRELGLPSELVADP